MVRKNIIDELFNPHMIKILTQEIFNSRKNAGDDDFIYDELEKEVDGKKYILKPRHIPLNESTDQAKSNCKDCHGTGRVITNIEKSRIKDPTDFVIISDMKTKGLSEEEMRKLVELEKKKKFWRVVTPCRCVMINMIKRGDFILSNDLKNIVIKVDCEEKSGVNP